MEALRIWLNLLSLAEKTSFASRCGTSIGYLRKSLSVDQCFSVELVIAIERESRGAVRCEDLRPDVDWRYLSRRKAS
jgi:DNA-binding transcriptional regulator YdaS (Cro superfamily)